MTLKAWLGLVKPQDFVIAFFGALTAAVALDAPLLPDGLLMGLILGVGILGADAYNDFVDRELDKVSGPPKDKRPLANGDLTPKQGIVAASALLVVTVALSVTLAAVTLQAMTLIAVLLYAGAIILYSYRAKPRWGIGGHLTASIAGSSVLVVPSVHTGNWSLFPMILGFLALETGREIVTSCSDYNGEVKMKYKTLPVLFGWQRALKWSFPFTAVFLLVAPWAVLTNAKLGSAYLVGVAVMGMSVLYCPLTYLMHTNLEFNWRWAQVTMKVGLLAFALLFTADVFFL